MKVMIIEADKEARVALQSLLEDGRFQVIALDSGTHMMSVLHAQRPDVLVLDHVLPGRSGNELVQDIRASSEFKDLPIMIVSGLAGESDKVTALETGADDYVTKPFYPRELAARIKALIRRSKREPVAATPAPASQAGQSADTQSEARTNPGVEILAREELKINFTAHRVTLRDREIPLTLTEFKILSELLKQSGRVLTRQNLREQALHNLNVTDRTIDVHMASLRKKLDAYGDYIETVRGVGYRFS